MKTAACVVVKGTNSPDGKIVTRPYTPITLNSHKGSFELLIKSYKDGNVSKLMDGLKVGDLIEVKGPFPKIEYKANMKKKIGMIAGGTGTSRLTSFFELCLRIICFVVLLYGYYYFYCSDTNVGMWG